MKTVKVVPMATAADLQSLQARFETLSRVIRPFDPLPQGETLVTDSSGTPQFDFLDYFYVRGLQAQLDALVLPSGVISQFGGSSAPTGYLLCDGSAISRSTYADLFDAIGTTYGTGNGTTTFNLPDLRQRFPLGLASSGTGSSLGATGGSIDHIHTVNPPSTTTSTPTGTVNSLGLLGIGSAASTSHTHTVDIAEFNSGAENPPYIALNYIIKI